MTETFPVLIRWSGDPIGEQGVQVVQVEWPRAMPLPTPGASVTAYTYYGRQELTAQFLRWEVWNSERAGRTAGPAYAPALSLHCIPGVPGDE